MQLFLRDACNQFRAKNDTLLTFPRGKDWSCPFEEFDGWLREKSYDPLPLAKDVLMDRLVGTGGFLNTRTSTFDPKKFLGLNWETRELHWTRIQVDTVLEGNLGSTEGMPIYEKWDTFADEVNAAAPVKCGKMMMSSFLWVRIISETVLVKSTIKAWAISNLSAFICICLFTRSLYISVLTALTIFMIVVCLVGAIVCVLGWEMGAMEALSVTIFVGMACDYCLHIAHAFVHSDAPNSHLKVRQGLIMVGNAVLGAAITTFGSSIFLLFCTIIFFNKMGIIIGINTICSLAFALLIFPSMLTLGDNDSGGSKKGQRGAGGGQGGGRGGRLGGGDGTGEEDGIEIGSVGVGEVGGEGDGKQEEEEEGRLSTASRNSDVV